MPNEKIAEHHFNNGKGATTHKNVLRLLWGKRNGMPDAPSGWVNAGYATIMISQETEDVGEGYTVDLTPETIKTLIKTLQKIQRQSFRGRVKIRAPR